MRTQKFKAQPTNSFFATVNQMLRGAFQLPTTAENCFVVGSVLNDLITARSACSNRKLRGAAEHLFDGSKKRICRLGEPWFQEFPPPPGYQSTGFYVRLLAVLGNQDLYKKKSFTLNFVSTERLHNKPIPANNSIQAWNKNRITTKKIKDLCLKEIFVYFVQVT